MQVSRATVIRRAVWASASNKVCVAAGGATLTTAAALGSWALAALASGAYFLGVGLVLRRPSTWQRAQEDVRREPPVLPEETDILDDNAKHLLLRVRRARIEREEVATQSLADGAAVLNRLGPSIVDLEETIADLLVALDRLGRYLLTSTSSHVIPQVERVGQRAMNAEDLQVRTELEEATRVLEARRQAFGDLSTSKDLLAARLEVMVGTIELLPCWLVRLHTQHLDREIAARRATLEALNAEMRALGDANRDTLRLLEGGTAPESPWALGPAASQGRLVAIEG